MSKYVGESFERLEDRLYLVSIGLSMYSTLRRINQLLCHLCPSLVLRDYQFSVSP